MLAMLAILGAVVAPRLTIDTDILALLPTTRDAAVEDALARLSASLAQRQLFLLGAKDLDVAKQSAQRFAATLSASGEFVSAQAEVAGDLRAMIASYNGYWPYLLADGDRVRLQADAESLLRESLRAAYTPAGMMRLLPLAADPLGLTGNFLQAQLPSLGNARLDGSMLVVASADRHFVLVTAETRGSAFAAEVQERVLPAIAAATNAAQAGGVDVEVVSSASIQHAAAATKQAKAEIGVFGTIETLAVLALLFYVFGNLRPLVLGVLVLGLSAAAAITASHFIFGKVHIMALVFGASLIGVVIDYSMHFFADRFRSPQWTAAGALAHVGPAILLGMLTTLVGYLGLVLLPFPGLRQIAAFCIVGIVVGAGSVLCLYPYLMSTRLFGGQQTVLPQRGPRVARVLDSWLGQWRWTPWRIAAFGALAVGALVGAARVQVQDDIRALVATPPALQRSEQRVQQVLGGGVETRFYLVQADDEQSVLEREEALRAALDEAVRDGQLGSYLALSRALPSQRRQLENHALLAKDVYRANGLYPRLMQQFGFSAAQIDTRLTEFREANRPLTFDAWLATPAANPYRHLWLGKLGTGYASVVMLSGIKNVAQLHAIATASEVRLIDRPREISGVMSRYRQVTTWLLVFANATALLMLGWRFGWRDGLRMVLPSAAACLVTLGIFGWLGVGFNLFNVFALLLVLALGVDYGIFLRHGQAARMTAILSVTLSACTTFIGFGMLAFSATPFIRSIGVTLLCGILCSWVFVMLSCMTQWRTDAGEDKK